MSPSGRPDRVLVPNSPACLPAYGFPVRALSNRSRISVFPAAPTAGMMAVNNRADIAAVFAAPVIDSRRNTIYRKSELGLPWLAR